MARKLSKGTVRYYIALAVEIDGVTQGELVDGEILPPGMEMIEEVYELDALRKIYVSTEHLGPTDIVDAYHVLSVPYSCFGCRNGKCVGCDDLHLHKQLILGRENAHRKKNGKAPLARMPHAHEIHGESCPCCGGTGKCEHCDGTKRTKIPSQWQRATRGSRGQWKVTGG